MLAELLTVRKPAILKRWLNLILESYPAETARFLRRESDQFLNPVGHTLAEGTRRVYEEVLQGADSKVLSSALDDIIRVRAVQDFSASQAVAFVFSLKRAIREELGGEIRQQVSGELLELEALLDRVALLAFDVYTRCREQIYELRVNEANNRSARVLERLNRMYGDK